MNAFVDSETLSYYTNNAEDVFQRYESLTESGISEFFPSSFLKGSKILDVGAGSGRDVRKLLELGFDAYGAEPVGEFRDLAVAKHPELEKRIFQGSLPDNLVSYQKYDGVVCSAVLMHLPPNVLFDAILALRDVLTEQGRLLISIPLKRSDVTADHRDEHGRLFNPLTANQLKLLCKRLAFDCIEEHKTDDALGRNDTAWHTLLFVRKSAAGKPLDRIESVLRNDKKVASYKLALLRAFCDVAEQDDHAVAWNPSGNIAIPTIRIAELWLIYYWPLISSSQMIPQNNAEATGGSAIAFRKPLYELIVESAEEFQINDLSDTQLLSAFMLAWKKGVLSDDLQKRLKTTLSKIRNAIITGPVKFASSGEMFSHNKTNDAIEVEAELWLEFCLTGYWVRDSLILRWAELCCRFGFRLPHLNIGIVMERLLQKPEVEREQALARKIYLQNPNLSCVWTGRELSSNSFDVDHALPFSLWYNNDLWNLLPASKKVNNQKRDAIPASSVFLKSRDRIIDNWQFTYSVEPELFKFEVQRTLGEFNSDFWEKPLFDHLKRKAEVAIFQRGAREWFI